MSCFQRFKYDSKKDLYPLCNVWKRTGLLCSDFGKLFELRYLESWNHLDLRLLFRSWVNNPWIFKLRLELFIKQFFSMLKNWINGFSLKHPLNTFWLTNWPNNSKLLHTPAISSNHHFLTILKNDAPFVVELSQESLFPCLAGAQSACLKVDI